MLAFGTVGDAPTTEKKKKESFLRESQKLSAVLHPTTSITPFRGSNTAKTTNIEHSVRVLPFLSFSFSTISFSFPFLVLFTGD